MEHHLEFLSLKGGCTGLSVSTLVKMPHCWKSYAVAQMLKLMGKKTIHNFMLENCLFRPMGRLQGSHRLEKYLNLESFLEKSFKINSALKSTGKITQKP